MLLAIIVFHACMIHTANADYTPLPAGTQITINSNAQVCLDISILNDNEAESNEDFTIVLTDPTNNVDLTVDPDTLTVTITDNDGKCRYNCMHTHTTHKHTHKTNKHTKQTNT